MTSMKNKTQKQYKSKIVSQSDLKPCRRNIDGKPRVYPAIPTQEIVRFRGSPNMRVWSDGSYRHLEADKFVTLK